MHPQLKADPSIQMVMYVLAICGLSWILLLLTCSVCCFFCHKKEGYSEGITTVDSSHINNFYYRTKKKSPLSGPTLTSHPDLFSTGPPSYSIDTVRQQEFHLSYLPAFLSFSRRLQFANDDFYNRSESDRYDSLVPQDEAYLQTV